MDHRIYSSKIADLGQRYTIYKRKILTKSKDVLTQFMHQYINVHLTKLQKESTVFCLGSFEFFKNYIIRSYKKCIQDSTITLEALFYTRLLRGTIKEL